MENESRHNTWKSEALLRNGFAYLKKQTVKVEEAKTLHFLSFSKYEKYLSDRNGIILTFMGLNLWQIFPPAQTCWLWKRGSDPTWDLCQQGGFEDLSELSGGGHIEPEPVEM